MGNAISPCCQQGANSNVKLIFWEGNVRVLYGKRTLAGEIMFEFPDRMVCHADSFYIGHPIPVLAIDDELMTGQTYFVLPLDHFSCTNILSAATLASLVSSPKSSNTTPINFKEFSPFEYIKSSNGRVLIKVMPEFMTKLITQGRETDDGKTTTTTTTTTTATPTGSPSHGFLCSTPELKKQYDQLVGSKEQLWSPKLETISEYKIRYSPCRFIGLERKKKEDEY